MGDTLRPQYAAYSDFATCDYVYSARLPGAAFMVRRDSIGAPSRVERIDVSEPGLRTDVGVGVGDSVAKAQRLYRGRLERRPNLNSPIQGADFLILSAPDTMYRIVFETDGLHVMSYRAGRRPAVEFGEGCA